MVGSQRHGYFAILKVDGAKSIGLTAKSLFLFLQPPLDAFARLGPERLGRETLFVILVPVRGGAEKTDLLSIAPTPFAEHQMNAQADALPQIKRTVQRPGLQSGRLAAIRRELARLSEESLQHFHQPIHCDLDFDYRQRPTSPGFVADVKQTLRRKVIDQL